MTSKIFIYENELVVNHTYPQLIAKCPPPRSQLSKNFNLFAKAFLMDLFSSVLPDYLSEIPFKLNIVAEVLCQRHAFLAWVYREALNLAQE